MVLAKYDMEKSQQRLREEGFHPSVTSKTPEEVEKAWLARVEPLLKRPTRKEFIRKMGDFYKSPFAAPRCLTTAMLLLRYESKYVGAEKKPAHTGDNMLATMLNTADVGGEIANIIFQQGWKSVLNTAITSSTTWQAVANSAKIWDFNAACLRTDGSSGVMLVVAPECTIGELNITDASGPFGFDSSNSLSSWRGEALAAEDEIYSIMHLIHRRITDRNKAIGQNQEGQKIVPVDFMADEIVSAVGHIREPRGTWGSSQFVSNLQSQLFQPPAMFSADRLKKMLNSMSKQKAALQVLYFEKIPLLDRRMIAVILRECSNVRMVGIYDCPLIHFGDVLCLVDLIYEINRKRREAGLPEITALDFYPRYNHGTPFQSPNSATYGLTWGPHRLDIVQRGFFNITLKAFMKAKRMNLGLLFDKDKAFCEYLRRIPGPPLAVPTFLDALHRYMEAKDEGSKTTVIYDLLKPVRLGLCRRMESDWRNGYMRKMTEHLVFCSSCGYETLQEFYSGFARQSLPHQRVCAGCTLKRWLDEEDDHLKDYKKQALDTLYPNWNGKDFNHDAPMPRIAKSIIKLQSTISVRPYDNFTTVDSEGFIYTRQVMLDLLRDNKIHWDSLVNLPTLADLLNDSQAWTRLYGNCINLDVYRRAVRCVAEQDEQGKRNDSFLRSRFDGGMPDTAQELQPPSRVVADIPCHDIASAITLHARLTKKGWGAMEKPAGKRCNRAEYDDGFW